jgi:hypothetical protein
MRTPSASLMRGGDWAVCPPRTRAIAPTVVCYLCVGRRRRRHLLYVGLLSDRRSDVGARRDIFAHSAAAALLLHGGQLRFILQYTIYDLTTDFISLLHRSADAIHLLLQVRALRCHVGLNAI